MLTKMAGHTLFILTQVVNTNNRRHSYQHVAFIYINRCANLFTELTRGFNPLTNHHLHVQWLFISHSSLLKFFGISFQHLQKRRILINSRQPSIHPKILKD